jgi:ABC-2 type transport system ATP-binding protein
MAEKMINVDQIYKQRHSKILVEDVSFSLNPSEICGVCGENGSGKTILMKILANMTNLTFGEITMNDEADQVFNHHIVGAYLGIDDLDEHMKVKQFLWQRCSLLKIKKYKKHLEEIDAFLHFSHLERSRFGELSSGHQALVALAQAFIGYPNVIVLDDPFAYLDHTQQENVKTLIRECCAHGVAFVISVKDMKELSGLMYSTLVLKNGRMVKHPEEKRMLIVKCDQGDAMPFLAKYHPIAHDQGLALDVQDDETAYEIAKMLREKQVSVSRLMFTKGGESNDKDSAKKTASH